MKQNLELVVIACLAMLVCAHAMEAMPVDAEIAAEGVESGAVELKTILATAEGNPDEFSTLVAAVKAVGLEVVADADEPIITVFAPNNAAFQAALAENDMTAEMLLASPNLYTIVESHVVLGKTMAADILGNIGPDGMEIVTIAGVPLKVTVDGDNIMVGDATVIGPDVAAKNGVIHIVDKVLVPLAMDTVPDTVTIDAEPAAIPDATATMDTVPDIVANEPVTVEAGGP